MNNCNADLERLEESTISNQLNISNTRDMADCKENGKEILEGIRSITRESIAS